MPETLKTESLDENKGHLRGKTNRVAPEGKFRVIGEDKYTKEPWYVGDYTSLPEATIVSIQNKKITSKMNIYDDQGKLVGTI